MPDHPLPVLDLEQITDAGARHAIRGLLNLVEELVTENRPLRAEVQRGGPEAVPRSARVPGAVGVHQLGSRAGGARGGLG